MTRTANAPALALAFVAGAVVAVQGRINGELGRVSGDGVFAAVVNFTVGLAALVLLVLVMPGARRQVPTLRGRWRSGQLPWFVFLGGLLGAVYVAAQGITVSLIGVAVFTVATVAGQTAASLLADRSGIGPGGRVPITPQRLVAAGLAVVAVVITGWGHGAAAAGGGVGPAVLLALVAGAAVAFQPAFNGRVAVATEQPLVAALVNFAVGLVALLAGLLLGHIAGHSWPSPPSPADHWWLYLGGLLGLFFVATAAYTVRALGLLLLTLVVLAGTLVGALVVDAVFPEPGVTLAPATLVGMGLTFVAVAVAVGPRRSDRITA